MCHNYDVIAGPSSNSRINCEARCNDVIVNKKEGEQVKKIFYTEAVGIARARKPRIVVDTHRTTTVTLAAHARRGLIRNGSTTITLHDNIYRTCIMDSDMASVLICDTRNASANRPLNYSAICVFLVLSICQ